MKFASVLLLLTALTWTGCASFGGSANGASDPRLADAKALCKEKRFYDAIAVYRRVQQDHPGTPLAAEAQYGISLATISVENPQRDYALGLEEFEEFIKLYPNHIRIGEAKTWRSALRQLIEAKKENERLKKNIEDLRKLDIRQEERRTRSRK